jgi:hypothetical protein
LARVTGGETNGALLCRGTWLPKRLLKEARHPSARSGTDRGEDQPSYVCRILRLTLLAPGIVDAILDGRQPARLMLANLMQSFPVGWQEQIKGWMSAG